MLAREIANILLEYLKSLSSIPLQKPTSQTDRQDIKQDIPQQTDKRDTQFKPFFPPFFSSKVSGAKRLPSLTEYNTLSVFQHKPG